jgi:hypothetical protein
MTSLIPSTCLGRHLPFFHSNIWHECKVLMHSDVCQKNVSWTRMQTFVHWISFLKLFFNISVLGKWPCKYEAYTLTILNTLANWTIFKGISIANTYHAQWNSCFIEWLPGRFVEWNAGLAIRGKAGCKLRYWINIGLRVLLSYSALLHHLLAGFGSLRKKIMWSRMSGKSDDFSQLGPVKLLMGT